MKALSIQQPHAWAILTLGQDILNRQFPTGFRGRFLIHAGQGFDHEAYQWLLRARAERFPEWPAIPNFSQYGRGCILGEAVLRDVVRASDSIWFKGPFGFVLQGMREVPFHSCRGQLGFFEVDPPYADQKGRIGA